MADDEQVVVPVCDGLDGSRICLCATDGTTAINIRSVRYCVDCCRYFCTSCIEKHNSFRAMATHRMLEGVMGDNDQQHPQTFPTEKCEEHHGNLLEMFCREHDDVCCHECAFKNHRECHNLEYITRAATGIKQSAEYADIITGSKRVVENLKNILSARQEERANLSTEYRGTDSLIKDTTSELRGLIDDMETSTLAQVEDCHGPLDEVVGGRITSLNETINELERALRNVENPTVNSESDIFVQLNILKHTKANGERKMRGLSVVVENSSIDFQINTSIRESLLGFRSLGKVNNDTPPVQDQLRLIVNISKSTNGVICNITGMCLLPNDRIILADWANKEIVRINSKYSVRATCILPVPPFDVCTIGPTEVAVTLPDNRQVMKALVGGKTMQANRSFKVGEVCRGIECIDGQLYVCCGGGGVDEGPGHIKVFDLSGTPIQKLHRNVAGQQIMSLPKYIAYDSKSALIYISDSIKGVIVTDAQGQTSSIISNLCLKGASGVAVIGKNKIVVCGTKSGNILQVGPGGEVKSVLLSSSPEMLFPLAVCYDAKRARLIATHSADDDIRVYDLT